MLEPGEQRRLRRDLIVSRQETTEGLVFVVKDPVTEHFFRFREAEHFIAQQLDSATPLELIRQRVEEKFGAPVPLETLQQFVERLRRLGLLEAEGAAAPLQQHSRRVRGALLYLRVPAFDPNRFFDWLLPRVRFFFTQGFLAVSATLILLAFGVTLANGPEIVRDFHRLFRPEALFLAWLTVFAVTTAHEFAHGLTCKHFGGEVHELGFMLIYFQPAFYCNVSDAWLFPEKSKRLWVTFAGGYFELFIWAVATLTWRLAEPDTGLSFLLLVVMATSGIKCFFNFNPLIKLDGYYLLSDYLEIPNLRGRAFAYLSATLKRLAGLGAAAAEVGPRERRIYLAYGLLAGAYSYTLLTWVALRFGEFFTERYQGFGFALYSGLLLVAFRNPLKRLLPRPPAGLTGRKPSPIWRVARIPVLFAAVGVLLFFGRMELKISGQFTALPAHNADVRTQTEGIIEEVYAEEGDWVAAGEPIARLSDRDSRSQLEQIDAEINEERAKLKMLQRGPRQEEIELARTRVEKARERVKYARSALDRIQTLFRENLASRQEIEEVEEQLALRGKEIEEAENELRLLLAGSRPEEIEASLAELTRLEARKAYLEKQVELLQVRSPIAGIVTTPKVKEKIGQHLQKGDLIVEVHDLRTITAEIAVSEKEIADVQLGQGVIVKARAYPQRSFLGKVTAIAPAARAGETGLGERQIVVTTVLDNSSLLLKPEMTGNAKIFCGERGLIDLVTRRVARYVRVEFWSWW